jgi:amidase
VEHVAARTAAAGARVESRLPEVDWEAQDGLFGELVTALTGVFDPGADLPPERRTLAWYLEALDRRDRVAATWGAFFEEVDALLLPTAPGGAFTHRETGAPLEVDGRPVSYWAGGRLVAFVSLAGLPALVVPAGPGADGLPIGLQLVGPRWSELRLLAIAGELERAGILPGFRAPTPLGAPPSRPGARPRRAGARRAGRGGPPRR